MKSIRYLLFLIVVCMIGAPVAMAQNGAVVVRDETVGAWGWLEDGLMVLGVTDMDFFCAPEDEWDEFYDTTMVIRPDGSVKYKEGGALYTRLFYEVTWDDLFDDFCGFWSNPSFIVAEGMANISVNDNDLYYDTQHPNRRNVWGSTLSGTLYTPFCESGMVDLSVIERFMLNKDKIDLHKYMFKFNVDCSE